MNKSYRHVWNKKQGRYVVASEVAKSHGGGFGAISKIVLAILGAYSSFVAAQLANNALPTNPNVVSGAASITQNANKLVITQSTDKLITNWNNFSIGKDASVQFVQPSASSSALNRVNGSDPSYIYGSLSANGKVILINQNGVMFSNGSRVDASNIIASTLSMSDSNFLSDKFVFEKNGVAGVINNAGELRAYSGGAVAVIAPQITNSGNISADAGSVALLAGEKVTLVINGNRLVKYTIDQGALNALVDNGGAIRATEGLVILSAKALDTISKSVVNNSGVIEAKGITQVGGKIILDADGGAATTSGVIDASSDTNQGGQVQITGQDVLVKSDAKILATGLTGGGTVLMGGSWQNSDKSIPQSINTTIESGAVVNASATGNGDGGTVVAWSAVANASSLTDVSGTLIANSGVNGGNGGRVETSGHVLTIGDSICVSAKSLTGGKSGEWLLDPYDINITATASGGTFAANQTYTQNTNIAVSSIVGALDAGTNVRVATGDSTYASYTFANATVPASAGTINLLPGSSSLYTTYIPSSSLPNLPDGSSVAFSFTASSSRVRVYYSTDNNVTWTGVTLTKPGGSSTYKGSVTLTDSFNGSPTPLTFKITSNSSSNRTLSYSWANAVTAGDITVLSAINTAPNADVTLTLDAARNININAAIAASGSNKLNLVLNSSSGYVNTSSSGTIATNGGDLTVMNSQDSAINSTINLGLGKLFKAKSGDLALNLSLIHI